MLGVFSRVFSQKENSPSWYFHPSFFHFYEDACGKMRHKVSERGNWSNQTWSDVTSKPVMPEHCNGHITSDRDPTRPQSSLCIETRNYLSPREGLEDFVRFTWFSGGMEGGGDICRWRSIKREVGVFRILEGLKGGVGWILLWYNENPACYERNNHISLTFWSSHCDSPSKR